MSGAGETRFLWRNFNPAELNGYKPVALPRTAALSRFRIVASTIG